MKTNNKYYRLKNKGFTIVELLVVIVIIGILAAIAIVSYTGITQKATAATLQSDLKNASTILEMDKVTNGTYPATAEEANGGRGLQPSPGNTLTYAYISGADTYGITAAKSGTSYHITSDDKTPTIGELPSAPTGSTFVKAWNYPDNSVGSYIAKTSDNGYVVTGGTGDDMFITKFDISGNLSWSRTWGGANYDHGNAVAQTIDGGYVVTGETDSFGAGYAGDMFVVKYDINGTLLWNKTWGNTGWDTGYSLSATRDGGCIVVGPYDSGSGSYDMFLVKYAADGTMFWNKTWDNSWNDNAASVFQTSDDGYIITGTTYNEGAGDDVLLVKYTADGTLSWSKTWGGADQDTGNSVIQTSDGGYAVTGVTYSFSAGDADVIVLKYDLNGNLVWNKTWGGTDYDYSSSIIQTEDGGYILAGTTASFGNGNGDILISKYTHDGTMSWTRTWGNTDYEQIGSVVQASDGGYALTGETDSDGGYEYKMFLMKYNSSGIINNCSAPMCQSPTATITSPTATVTEIVAP